MYSMSNVYSISSITDIPLYFREESSDESDTEMEVDGVVAVTSTSKAKHDIIIKQEVTMYIRTPS